jgi:hypothetical protein
MSFVRVRIIVLLIVTVVANTCAFTQDVGAPAATAPRIFIEFPDNIPSEAVWIRYSLSGLGGYGKVVKREPNVRTTLSTQESELSLPNVQKSLSTRRDANSKRTPSVLAGLPTFQSALNVIRFRIRRCTGFFLPPKYRPSSR